MPLVLHLTSIGWMCVGEGDVSGWVLTGGCRDFIPTQVVCIPIGLLYFPLSHIGERIRPNFDNFFFLLKYM